MSHTESIELNIVYERTHNEDGLRLILPEINNSNREVPIGYNVYRDNSIIAFTQDTWHLDTNILPASTYCYNVTAVYENYQSLHTEQICIETENNSLSGDLNGDSQIDILDIIILVNMIIYSEGINYNADMDSDGILTVLDIILIINIILEES